ncbi:hypothetical protein Zmor_001756 [Zophobas morio]|uniref:RING-type domain-containing protein n=1 Tax=Zophobas morio TaxID=2755281 RepID=A0AA38MT37_9CUCU|nr:hypothetical protein Zmor_001756 [Zophobas morio]
MGYQGVALLIAAFIGIGFAAYQYYTQQNTAYTQDSQSRSHVYTYVPPSDEPTDDTCRKRRRSSLGDKCSICQETLMGHIRHLSCKHSFHKDCIEEWFKESRTCPVCRRVV